MGSAYIRSYLLPPVSRFVLHLSCCMVHHSLRSAPEQQKPTTGSPEDWVEWLLYRLHNEPWALGGLLVIALFVLGTLSLVVFSLLYGCCCTPEEQIQKKKPKKSKDGVI